MKRNPYLSILRSAHQSSTCQGGYRPQSPSCQGGARGGLLRTALAALLIAAAASCSDDAPNDVPTPGTDGTNPEATNLVTVRFGSGGDDATPETRTTIDADGEIVRWTTDDEISISAVRTDVTGGTNETNKKYNPATAEVNSTFNPADGGEEMQLPEGTYTFYSYYPHWFNAMADKVLDFALYPMTQTDGTSSDHIGKQDFMWAREENVPISGTESPQVSFNYKHIFPMLVFKIDPASTKKVKCISVRSADGTTPVQGRVDVSLADGTIEAINGYYCTWLTFTTPMDKDGTGRLLILPQEAGANLIIGVLTTDNVLYEYTRTAANALEGGKSYDFKFDLKAGDVPNRTVYAAPSVDPEGRWQIVDESGLRAFALAVNYYGQSSLNATLTADITLSAYATWEESIGIDYTIPYQGTFNGGGHTVSGLAINRTSGASHVGLFGRLDGATVQNLRVTGSVNAGASSSVGGIAGYNDDSTLENCLFDGDVTGYSNVGGIVGGNSGGIITACFSSGSVTAKGNYNAGGIAGNNSVYSTITHCYSSATVIAENEYAGGIVGENYIDSKVTSCYATGAVSANKYAGGIAGNNDGSTLENCLALGSAVTRTGTGNSTYFRRVAGYNDGTITNCAAWEGMTLPDGITATDNANDKHGANLTTDACKKKATYTDTRGFDGTVWSFDDQATWEYLPWNQKLYGYWPDAARIRVPDHLTSQPN